MMCERGKQGGGRQFREAHNGVQLVAPDGGVRVGLVQHQQHWLTFHLRAPAMLDALLWLVPSQKVDAERRGKDAVERPID
eukprot:2843909-Rhodomonas_salina.2